MKDINNMDRKPIRKFKRLFKKNEEYDFTFKKQMDIINFKQKDFFLENMIDEKIIYDIKESKLTKQLISLPKEIQKKLYILAMRNYWKHNTMNTIYKPMYHDYYSYVEKEKGKVYYDNIHFMHLDFNTLESNKEWIPGCQCSFCLNDDQPKYTKEYKQKIYDKMLEEYDMEEYDKCTHCYDIIPNYWNSQNKYVYQLHITTDGLFQNYFLNHKIYDPLKTAEGTIYDQIKEPDSPLYFSNEVINHYNS
tara:strand:- start:373 stop:1116 length:744 start_codon:yes stop_codon:yes gene_type:complete